MVKLDYYFRCDVHEVNAILKKGLSYDYFKTAREYGFSLYLTDKPNLNLNNKNIILDVHMKNLDNILVVTNFDELLNEYLLPIEAVAIININTASAPATISGVVLSPGDTVALAAQTNIQENGIYLFHGVGLALERTTDVLSYINSFGKTERLGTKYVQNFMVTNGYSGLRVTSENLLVLYDTINIKYIKVYDKKKI